MPPESPHLRAIVTVVTESHLIYALTLVRSCLAQEPDCDLFICVVDCLDVAKLECFKTDPKVQLLGINDLGLSEWRRIAFQYTTFEFVCACKAFAMRTLRQKGYTDIVYIDADMWLYRPMYEVWNKLVSSAVLLTPHLVHPLPNDGKFPREVEYLRSGTFNAGFIAIKGNKEGDAMVDWWCNRMQNDCIVDILGASFVDQKWLNLVPGMFSSVEVLRHSGYNAGHWSLSQFTLSRSPSGEYLMGGDNLVLFHFSKFLPEEPFEFERQQNRVLLKDQPNLEILINNYHHELQITRELTKLNSKNHCRFDRLTCGVPIEPYWREAIRRDHQSLKDVVDPFNSVAVPNLVQRYRSLEGESRTWRADWKYGKGRKSRLAQDWKKLRRRVKDWWTHR